MIRFVCILLVAIYTFAQPSNMVFTQQLLSSHVDESDVERYKNLILEENKKKIEEHNSRPKIRYKLKINAFASLNEKQIKQKYFGLIPSNSASISFAKAISTVKDKQKQSQKQQVTAKVQMNESKQTEKSTLSSPKQNTMIKVASLKRVAKNTPKTTAADIQNQILSQVKTFLLSKDISETDITSHIIPAYKHKGNLSQLSLLSSQNRLLTIVANGELSAQKKQLKNVDWSCISGRVKAQGDCGACYAFATADNVGAVLGIYYYTFFVELSIQNILDCTENSLVFGCKGGFLEGALAQMMYPGIYTEYTYPYTSSQSFSYSESSSQGTCKKIAKNYPKFRIGDFRAVNRNDCEDLKLSLQRGPVSVAITGYKLTFYGSGVFDGCDETDTLDHAVLLVGWKAGVGWKIKNSWGTRWGEKGYAWLQEGNQCRICQVGFYPVPQEFKGSEKYESGKMERMCPQP